MAEPSGPDSRLQVTTSPSGSSAVAWYRSASPPSARMPLGRLVMVGAALVKRDTTVSSTGPIETGSVLPSVTVTV